MQGFNHIIIYDNNSTTSLSELDTWIKDGFVSIQKNWWQDKFDDAMYLKQKNSKHKFNFMMRIKMVAEVSCKQYAADHGYEVFASLDMDEYLFPSHDKILVVDELYEWFNKTTRGVAVIPKFQFPPTPHILEPINLLTIEAYQTKNHRENKMNYYTSVSPKVALRLFGSDEYTTNTTAYVIYCCDFHGCANYRFNRTCSKLYQQGERWKIEGKHKPWRKVPHIHHYARTLEKFALKQTSWDTAGAGRGYDFYNYFERLVGHEFDDSALVWACQTRETLRNRTNQTNYLRPGNFWYKNPEFGKSVEDNNKRGRHGAGHEIKIYAPDFDPYPPGETYQAAHKTFGE